MNNIYIVILKDGKKFYLESYEGYNKIFERYKKRYGDNLACVLKEYMYCSVEEIKKDGGIKNG